MLDVTFELPPMEGFGLDAATIAAFESFGGAVRRAVEELNDLAQDPATIIIETPDGPRTLRDLGYAMPRRGTVWMFHCSWSTARSCKGWLICDGTNGTPKIHPHPKDLSPVQRFPRATAWGCNSGGTGGSTYHTHDDHLADDIAVAIKDHVGHTHVFSGSTQSSDCYLCATEGEGESVSHWCHYHEFSGTTNSNLAGRNHEAEADSDLSHSLADHTNPYCDVIFMMKE